MGVFRDPDTCRRTSTTESRVLGQAAPGPHVLSVQTQVHTALEDAQPPLSHEARGGQEAAHHPEPAEWGAPWTNIEGGFCSSHPQPSAQRQLYTLDLSPI